MVSKRFWSVYEDCNQFSIKFSIQKFILSNLRFFFVIFFCECQVTQRKEGAQHSNVSLFFLRKNAKFCYIPTVQMFPILFQKKKH